MSFIGMDPFTGKELPNEQAHVAQSIRDILTTPLGSRVMRRDYGCNLFYYIDQPFNAVFQAKMQAAIAAALRRWEPRIRFHRVTVAHAKPTQGRFELALEGYWIINNELFQLKNLSLQLT